MRRYLLLIVLLLCGTASAQARFTVEPGRFLSIPLLVTSGDEVTVDLPAWLRLTGTPQLRNGHALINLLAEHNAPAGEAVIEVQVREAGRLLEQVPISIIVARRVSFSLDAPSGDTVIAGDSATYALTVTNTGNTNDSYHFMLTSGLQARFSPALLELQSGERGTVSLELRTQRQRSDIAIVRVVSALEPEVHQSRVITTTILPFAGADALEGPALAYELNAAALYGPDGFDYALGARLAGDLSEFVQLDSDLKYHRRLSGRVALAGEGWGVTYRGFAELQNLEARYGRVRGFLSVPLGRSGFTAGASYAHEALTVSLTHSTAAIQTDSFRAAYTFQAGPTLTLSPSIGVGGSGDYDGDYRLSALLGLKARLQTDLLNAALQFSFTLPQEPVAPWSLTASASNRVQTKFGLSGHVSADSRNFHAGVTAREVLSSEVTFSQGVRYAHRSGTPAVISANIGVSYRPETVRLGLHGQVSARWSAGQMHFGFGADASYSINDWSFELAVEEQQGVHVRVGAAYRLEPFELRTVFGYGPQGSPLLLGAAGSSGGLRASMLAGYDFRHDSFAAELDLDYQFTSNFGSFLSLAYDAEDLRLRVGANARFKSGFATPDRIVDLFGGRAIGWIEGRVFADVNRNAIHDAGEAFVPGAIVSIGGVNTETDIAGSFRLAVPAGSYTLTVSSVTAGLTLVEPLQVAVSINEVQQVVLPLQTVAGLTGLTFDDRNRDGSPDEEVPLPYALVQLEQVGGQQLTTRSDDRGRFFFQNLLPGAYRVSLDPASLPQYFEPTMAPQQLQLQPGPFPRILLGATAREKTVTSTFIHGDLALTVRTEPVSSPAGADITVIASTQGEPAEVTAYLSGSATELIHRGDGVYSAIIMLPDTPGVANLEVVASDDSREVRRSITLLLQPGELARLQIQPPFLEPAESAQLVATFLTRVDEAFILFDSKRHDLTASDQYTFSGAFTAPAEPGSYEVELWADGQLFTTARFRVE